MQLASTHTFCREPTLGSSPQSRAVHPHDEHWLVTAGGNHKLETLQEADSTSTISTLRGEGGEQFQQPTQGLMVQ